MKQRIVPALTATLAATALGVVTTLTGAAPASAVSDPSRLPYAGEVQAIYPYLAGGDRRTTAGRDPLTAPTPEDIDGGSLGCIDDVSVAVPASGKYADYRNARHSSGPFLHVELRRFGTAAKARAAYSRVARMVQRCEGGYPNRAEGLLRRTLDIPRYGQARIGYREIDTGFSVYRVRIVVLRGNKVIVTEHERDDGAPSQAKLEQLTSLALRTL